MPAGRNRRQSPQSYGFGQNWAYFCLERLRPLVRESASWCRSSPGCSIRQLVYRECFIARVDNIFFIKVVSNTDGGNLVPGPSSTTGSFSQPRRWLILHLRSGCTCGSLLSVSSLVSFLMSYQWSATRNVAFTCQGSGP